MHIVLGALTTIVTILWLLHRLAEMGIDLGGLNPWYWRRRRAWHKKYEGDPVYATEDPMEVAALFVTGVARLDGEISAEQKNAILGEFASGFRLSDKEASQLLGSCTHLLGGPQVIQTQLEGLMERHRDLFSPDQAQSFLTMAENVVSVGQSPTAEQRIMVGELERRFSTPPEEDSTWAQGH